MSRDIVDAPMSNIRPVNPFAWNIPQVIGTRNVTSCPDIYVFDPVDGTVNVTTVG
jgi:hypothetical protein